MTTVIPLNPPPPLTHSIKASQYLIILLLNIISGIIVRILVFRKYYFMMDRDKIQSGYITAMEQDIMNTGYTYITVMEQDIMNTGYTYITVMEQDIMNTGYTYITVMEQDIMNTGYTYITVRNRLGRDRMGVRFTATYAICAYHH
jgi:hypothetical protein